MPPNNPEKTKTAPDVLVVSDAKDFAKSFLITVSTKSKFRKFMKLNAANKKGAIKAWLESTDKLDQISDLPENASPFGYNLQMNTKYYFKTMQVNLNKLTAQLFSLLSNPVKLKEYATEVKVEIKKAKQTLKEFSEKKRKRVLRKDFLKYLAKNGQDEAFMAETSHEGRKQMMKEYIEASGKVPKLITGKLVNILFRYMLNEFTNKIKFGKLQKELSSLKAAPKPTVKVETDKTAPASKGGFNERPFLAQSQEAADRKIRIANKLYNAIVKSIITQLQKNQGTFLKKIKVVDKKLNAMLAKYGVKCVFTYTDSGFDGYQIQFDGKRAWNSINTRKQRRKQFKRITNAFNVSKQIASQYKKDIRKIT